MVLARIFEDRLASLYRAGGIVGGVYLGRGQEAFSAAMAAHLIPGTDIFSPLIRDQAGRFGFGEPVIDAARTYLGSAAGPMRGRDGNIHRGRPADGISRISAAPPRGRRQKTDTPAPARFRPSELEAVRPVN